MSATNFVSTHLTIKDLQVDKSLFAFINDEILAGVGVNSTAFWQGFSDLVTEFMPRNKALLKKRDSLQGQIDTWHKSQKQTAFEFSQYKSFLQDIGYLVAEGDAFKVSTTQVDDEIALQAGPQLVVPVMNARFALNACNARWGSLYDALYGTDVLPEDAGAEKTSHYNPIRGEKVIAYGREFLNQNFPLNGASFNDVVSVTIGSEGLVFETQNGSVQLQNPAQFLGYQGDVKAPSCLLLSHNGLRAEIQFDRASTIGGTDKAGIKDIVLESALTTIMDCEDSVAAVDAADKIVVYRNWLGLMKGDLVESVTKNGKTFSRVMAPDREYIGSDGKTLTLHGRSLMFVRNVGHLMTTPAILTKEGEEIPEGIMDAAITSAAAMYDIQQQGQYPNSRTGSVYIVKPKMHGPEEVAFTNDLFGAVENLLGLATNTLKVGIMDEERRTSINLKECIRQAQSRVVFINTGFLDRTGDEIHTSMEAGPFAGKDAIKSMPWIQAYERNNVAVGLACGLKGKAQIGKGMWAMPDNMADMMKSKVAQPKAGANTAWVPSPTAATLHVMHYHAVSVADVQTEMLNSEAIASNYVDTILSIPLLGDEPLTADTIQTELENNAQGILGYVVRWIDQGVGCSKVPDIHNTPLMEDRATLRISSQHICNWLHHNICTEEQVMAVMKAMAAVVDKQNANDPLYTPMADNLAQSIAFKAASDLVFKGREQPNGYTEPLLHSYRLQLKSQA